MSEYLRLALLIEERRGKIGVLEIVSKFSSFIVPFLFWFQIYLLFTEESFVFSWVVFLGLVVFSFLLLPALYIQLRLLRFPRKLMEKIELAKCVFNDQTNTESEGKFEGEADRFGVPYVYFKFLFFSAAYTRGKLLNLLLVIVTLALETWCSYAIATLLVINKNSILSILSFCPLEVVQFFNFLIPQYLLHLITLFYCLSLVRALDPINRQIGRLSKFIFSGRVFMQLFSLSGSIRELCGWILSGLHTLRWRRFTLRIIPFIKTISVSSIIEKSVRNVKGNSCKFLQRTYQVVDDEDIETIKEIIMDQRELPFIMRLSLKSVKPSDVLDVIKVMHPLFYLCVIGNKCAVVGEVRYVPSEKAYVAYFDFDSKYVKEEFESIMNKEIEKQRELK